MMGVGAVWLILVVVVALVGAVVVAATGSSGANGQESQRAHEILRQRLATGEIDEDEYTRRAAALGASRPASNSLRRWLPLALVAVGVVVLVAVLASGPGTSTGWWGPMGGHMDGMMGQRSGTGSTSPAIPEATEVTIEATEMRFDPEVVEVPAGEPVNLTLDNRGEAYHDLTIDELDVQIGVDPGGTETTGLEIDEPGEYTYYCSVPGHASAGMEGTLTVVESADALRDL